MTIEQVVIWIVIGGICRDFGRLAGWRIEVRVNRRNSGRYPGRLHWRLAIRLVTHQRWNRLCR